MEPQIVNYQNQPMWWQSVIIGASGGIMVWFVGFLQEQFLQYRDVRRILKFFRDEETKKRNFEFCTIKNIAARTNMTEDRARFICFSSKKIEAMERGVECFCERK